MASDSDLGQHMGAVAAALLGEPNKALSKKGKPRYGSHGSFEIDLAKGTAYSFEDEAGGGVLWLIQRVKGWEGKRAFDFMREIGCDVPEEERKPKENGHDHRAEPPEAKREIEATYDYVDEGGKLLFQTVRFVFRLPDGKLLVSKDGKREKTFGQRRKATKDDPPDTVKNGWVWSVKGAQQVPYRLPELMEAIAGEREILFVEGEKKVDWLWSVGVPATCNCGGAGKWPDELAPYFKGAHVVFLPDNDPQKTSRDGKLMFHDDGRPMHAGRDHVDLVAAAIKAEAATMRVLELPGLPPKGDVIDWRDAGGTVEQLNALVAERARPWAAPTRGSRFGLIMWADQDSATVEEYEYLVEDLIPKGEPVLIIGESQSGKSYWTRDLAMAGARGIHFFGRRVLEPFGVIYCAYEAGKGFNNRMKAYRRHHRLELTDLPFALLTRPADLWSDAVNVDQMIEEILWIEREKFGGVKLGAVVIDTHNAATSGASEIDSKEVSTIRDRYKKIMAATRAGAWIIGHKNASGKHRGSELLANNIETQIDISVRMNAMDPGGKTLVPLRDRAGLAIRHAKILKQREGETGPICDFVLPQIEIGINRYGKPRTACVALDPQVDPGQAQAEEKPRGPRALTSHELVILQALRDAQSEHGVPPPASLKLPKSITTVVDKAHWRAEYLKKTFDEEKKDDTVNKRLARARDEFLKRRIIGFIDPWAWVIPPKRQTYGDQPPTSLFEQQKESAQDMPDTDDEPML